MSGTGITYLRTSKKFPPFIRLEGRRGDYEVYTPERTCKNAATEGYSFHFRCSECGYSTIVHNCTVRLDELPNYCPNCGARVVGGDAE